MNGNMTLGSRIERLEKNNKPIETTDNIRIGNVIADGTMGGSTSKNINVVFDKPLKSINYSVALSSTFGGENWGSVATTIGNKTENGFTISLWSTGSTSQPPSFDWIAIQV